MDIVILSAAKDLGIEKNVSLVARAGCHVYAS
jgi:hypothetical protein